MKRPCLIAAERQNAEPLRGAVVDHARIGVRPEPGASSTGFVGLHQRRWALVRLRDRRSAPRTSPPRRKLHHDLTWASAPPSCGPQERASGLPLHLRERDRDAVWLLACNLSCRRPPNKATLDAAAQYWGGKESAGSRSPAFLRNCPQRRDAATASRRT